MIFTDPPYELTSKYRITNHAGKKFAHTNDLEYINCTKGIDMSICDEFMRVMKKPNIYIWCNKMQIIPYLNYFVGEHNCKFEILVWIKSNPLPLCGSNYLIDKEYCLYFRKGIKLHTSYQSAKTYWITPTNQKDKKKYGHPTIKPLNIMETLIKNSSYPGDLVADPFIGSGTSAAAAIRSGRCFIGVEKNEINYDICLQRLEESKRDLLSDIKSLS